MAIKIGIDFGTTNSSVYTLVYDSQRKERVARSMLLDKDRHEASSVPTVLKVSRDSILCGHEIGYGALQGTTVIYNLKERLLDDYNNEKYVYEDNRSGWKKENEIRSNDKVYDKWELFRAYMKYLLKNVVDNNMYMQDNTLIEAVISVPFASSTIYNEKMKKNIEMLSINNSRGEECKIKVLDIIEEPVAIGFLYLIDKKTLDVNLISDKKTLVVDIGGGTTDIAVLQNDRGSIKPDITVLDYDCITAIDRDCIINVIDHDGNKNAGNYIDKTIIKYLFVRENIEDPSYEEFISTKNKNLNPTLLGTKETKETIEKTGESEVYFQYNRYDVGDYILTKEEYYKILGPYVKELLELSKRMIDKHNDITNIVLAGGVANCNYIKNRFKEEFSKYVVYSGEEEDNASCTAKGNLLYANRKTSIRAKLTNSYGLRVYDKDGVRCIRNFAYQNQNLPIENIILPLHTEFYTNYVDFEFYRGHEEYPTYSLLSDNSLDYNFNNYTFLDNHVFRYTFGKYVPANTMLKAIINIDNNEIISVEVISEYATIISQRYTLTELEGDGI